MSDSVTFDGDVEALREFDGVRASNGPRGTVDVFDDQFGLFRRVDKGDKVERFGSNGVTVVRSVETLDTKESVASRGAKGDEDTSKAGGFLSADSPNVQQEVKDGGPTEEDELDKSKAEGGDTEGEDDDEETPKKASKKEKKQAEDDEAHQAKAAKGGN